MKTSYQLILAALAVCITASCSSGHDETPEPIKIPISLSCGITPIATRATDNGFETNDRIGLYVVNYNGNTPGTLLSGGNHVDNMQFTYNGTWTPSTAIYWKDDSTPADFYCYYPYGNDPTDVSALPFEVMADQSTEANYKACDFMWGKATNVSPTEQVVQIKLNHLFSCAVVKVAAGNGFTDEALAASDVQVKLNHAMRKAAINLNDGSLSPQGETGSVTFLRGTDNEFKALVIPQNISSTADFITVTIDGKDFNMEKGFSFVSGHRHTFTVTVKKTSNGINVDIGAWVDDGTDNGGIAE